MVDEKVEGTEIASDLRVVSVANDIILQIESESGDWPSVMRKNSGKIKVPIFKSTLRTIGY